MRARSCSSRHSPSSPRCVNFLLSCPIGRSEEIFTCLNTSALDLTSVVVQVPYFLASNFRACFKTICTTSELLEKTSMRTSTDWTFLLTSFHKSFCDASESDFSSLPHRFWGKKDFTGIPDTPCHKVSLRSEFQQSSFRSWVVSNVLATATE